MSSPSDPLRVLVTARRWIDGVVALGTIAVGVWAFAPLGPGATSFTGTAQEPVEDAEGVVSSGLPLAAFDQALWYVPPPPPAVVPPPRPPEMPRLELIGIVRQGDAFQAMIADPAEDRIHSVTDGDRFGVTRVVSVSHNAAHCEAHGVAFQLTLDGATP